MLGLQGNASSSKEYRCVACSATFTGLAALLVHQATHASTLPKPVQNCSDNMLLEASPQFFSTIDNQTSLPKILSPVIHKCDCGEEFGAFDVMMSHKQSHASEGQPTLSVSHELMKRNDSSNSLCEMTATQTNIQREDATAGSSIDEPPSFKNSKADVNHEESTIEAITEGQSPVPTDLDEQYEKTLAAEETEGNDLNETVPENNPPDEDGNDLVSPISIDNNNIVTSLKEETEPVVITRQTAKWPSTDTDVSTMQIKRLLGKPGMKTKAPSISRLLESSTKKIVTLTKIFSPVVLLETRQKFIGSDTYGNYQCSRCRKGFQDVDSLTEHHFMHKKERIKCCRCCKQLIIGRVPLPDNHICPQSGGKTVSSLCLKNDSNIGQNVQINNPKKVYFCPICKHNFARRYNLKIHKCHSPLSIQSQQVKSFNNAGRILNECNVSQSIGVGTQVRTIKVEDDFKSDLSNMSWASQSSIMKQHKNASAFAASFLQVQDNQWTAPLPTNTNTDLHTKGKRVRLSTVLRDGVRRYACEKCHKTFGLSSNLCRHKKVCSVKPKGLGNQYSSNTLLNSNVPVFSCYVCGRNFNRKDNMIVHRKKCELRRTMIPTLASEINSSLPSSNTSSTSQDQAEEDEGSWSIMSLPSVLPRRVTCECGIGFTSPKLLLEHLQKHAQESYTCPTCGVTVKSWADYEIHLQLHMHSQHHKHPQSLLLQLKKNMPELQQCQNVNISSKPAPQIHNHLKNQTRKQPFACPKCSNTFASRCTLRRHLTWSQCSGGGSNVSINYNLFSLQHRLNKQI